MPAPVWDTLTELRLRLDGPLSLTAGGKNLCVDASGRICKADKGIICTAEDISTCLSLLTNGSLYSYGDAIRQGYIPFGKGGRAGICGAAAVRDGSVTGFTSIQGISLRVCRFVGDCGEKAVRYIDGAALRGGLVCSPPNRGKTTLLRSIAALLSAKYRVALADERSELYVPQLSAGLTDRISGVRKSVAIPMLCRSMSPQVIVCDELAEEDEGAIHSAIGAGVCIIASAHGESTAAVRRRPFIGRLLAAGAFPLLIGIGADYKYTVEEAE